MRASFAKIVTVLLLTAFSVSQGAAETIRVAGTGTVNGMLKQLGAKFTAGSGDDINVIPGLGSAGALAALKDGLIDLAVSARPLKDKDTAAGLRQVMVLHTAFVLATSQPNANGLKSADLPSAYGDASARWQDGTPIRVILRPRVEIDNEVLAAMSPGMSEAIERARSRGEVPVAPTDQDNIEVAERTPGSLTGTTMAQLKTERSKLQVVPIDGLQPTLANLESGKYPFVKHLYVVLRQTGPAMALAFVDFLRTPQGMAALRETEILPDTN